MRTALLLAAALLLAGCASGGQGAATAAPAAQPAANGMKISSPAFADGEMIPPKHTCDGENVSPPLEWSGAPAGTAALALIVEDPDAPLRTFIHWVVLDLPATSTGLPEGVPAQPAVNGGGIQATTSFNTTAYGGPCPPSGTHRYYFRLYALDAKLALGSDATAAEAQKAMQGHALAETALMGRYKRQ